RGVGAEELSGLPECLCPVGYWRLRLRLALRLARTLGDHCLGGLLALVDVCLKDAQSEGREPELGDLPAGVQRRPRIEEAPHPQIVDQTGRGWPLDPEELGDVLGGDLDRAGACHVVEVLHEFPATIEGVGS